MASDDSLRSNVRLRVLHVGVPIGWVELPEGRLWSGGMLTPESAYEAVGSSLREATALVGANCVAELPMRMHNEGMMPMAAS